ncbi:MAG: hypothetical protein H6510_08405 [Acidobacteria bacterium]|nr:hypothetical protein [Acidobacteriota bacterium]MCB9397822.1 hypothetical protein [Acidobacteriota bacterium]
MRLLPKTLELGWGPYFWLVYLVPALFVTITLDNLPYQLFFASGLLAFFFLYFRGYWLTGKDLYQTYFGLMGLGLIYTPFSPVFSVYFVYSGAFLGRIGPPKHAYLLVSFLFAVVVAQALFLPPPLFAQLIPAVVLLIVAVPNIQMAAQHKLKNELLRSQEEVEHLSRVAERERIARDLHDLLGHSLSLIVLKAQLAKKLVSADPDRATHELADLEREARAMLAETRKAIQGWQARTLEEEIKQARNSLETAGIAFNAKIAKLEIPERLETAMALILREATTNILRHARARQCTVQLEKSQHWHLEIADDGCGMQGQEGSGLAGMRARCEALSGQMAITSEAGTYLSFQFPLEAQ